MINLVVEESSDFTFRDFEFERVNCGEKKAHLLRVGKDSAGFHKVHESKFLSSYFLKFSGGEPPDPHQAFSAPELGFI